MHEEKKKVEDNQVKAILESVHVRDLGDGTVELTHGINKCVRKIHTHPQHLRGEE